jgi:hypothetical protein
LCNLHAVFGGYAVEALPSAAGLERMGKGRLVLEDGDGDDACKGVTVATMQSTVGSRTHESETWCWQLIFELHHTEKQEYSGEKVEIAQEAAAKAAQGLKALRYAI